MAVVSLGVDGWVGGVATYPPKLALDGCFAEDDLQ